MPSLWPLGAATALLVFQVCSHRSVEVEDGFEESFSQLHVTPSTHRAGAKGQPVVLDVTFSLRPVQALRLRFPAGYALRSREGVPQEAAPPGNCQLLAATKASPYATEVLAKDLAEELQGCGLEGNDLVLQLKTQEVPLAPASNASERRWWHFNIEVRTPEETPPDQNWFELHWSSSKGVGWEGSTTFQAWPILGDWDCAYSDWENWGSCTARCGGGTQTLRRRILVEPPLGGSGRNCSHEDLSQELPCNEHPCVFDCCFEEVEDSGGCSADCGGGVKILRRRWSGEKCPAAADDLAQRLVPCNQQPCRVPCRLADDWTVMTECSKLCGPGHYWMFRQVVQKDPADDTCQPDMRKVPCVKQLCTPLTVIRSDRNIIPYPGDAFRVGLVFELPVLARKIELYAPEGFSFGNVGDGCEVIDNDMMPHFDSCKVTDDANKVSLSFLTPLPLAEQGGRYQFMIDVTNRRCAEGWLPDPLRTTATCDVSADRNRWRMEFAEEGTTRWEALSAQGFAIYAPFGAQGHSDQYFSPSEVAGTPATEGAAKDAMAKASPAVRQDFCSKRLPCKAGERCSSEGLCVAEEQTN